jgi:predicted DNA-binding transcriptional regulator AlpA
VSNSTQPFPAHSRADPTVLLVTADDIAAALRISRRTVFRLRTHDDFPPPVELGRHVVRWRWADVCDYLARLKARDGGSPTAANTLRRKGMGE